MAYSSDKETAYEQLLITNLARTMVDAAQRFAALSALHTGSGVTLASPYAEAYNVINTTLAVATNNSAGNWTVLVEAADLG